jgi:hypothetical protein
MATSFTRKHLIHFTKEKVMKTEALKHVRQIFMTYDAPPQTIRSYQRQWVRSVRNLGDNWLLAKKIQRFDAQKSN